MENYVKIKERFLEFQLVTDSSGAGLSDVIVNTLNEHGLDLNNFRG